MRWKAEEEMEVDVRVVDEVEAEEGWRLMYV